MIISTTFLSSFIVKIQHEHFHNVVRNVESISFLVYGEFITGVSVFYKNIPVLVLSSNEKSQERIKFLEAGVDEYMMKPFSPQELKARINNIFKRYNYASLN